MRGLTPRSDGSVFWIVLGMRAFVNSQCFGNPAYLIRASVYVFGYDVYVCIATLVDKHSSTSNTETYWKFNFHGEAL